LLTGGSRTALPRRQTLRATIDWSYNLLSAAERGLLRRFAVFAGGGTLEAIEAVCPGEGLKDCDALEILTHLVDKSLVLAERKQGEEPRHYLLETIRQYAREKLNDSGEGQAVRERHTWPEHSWKKTRGYYGNWVITEDWHLPSTGWAA
jgi:predicted ATPase